jgi:predicted negative regulator of RcsB-dependent stress response
MGAYHPNAYKIHLALGDCCVRLGDREEALSAYALAKSVAERIFKPDSEQIRIVNSKISELNTLVAGI